MKKMEDETENIMITFKGCRIKNSISLWGKYDSNKS